MTKFYTVEVPQCLVCPAYRLVQKLPYEMPGAASPQCHRLSRNIPVQDVRAGRIPDWCPLPDAESFKRS